MDREDTEAFAYADIDWRVSELRALVEQVCEHLRDETHADVDWPAMPVVELDRLQRALFERRNVDSAAEDEYAALERLQDWALQVSTPPEPSDVWPAIRDAEKQLDDALANILRLPTIAANPVAEAEDLRAERDALAAQVAQLQQANLELIAQLHATEEVAAHLETERNRAQAGAAPTRNVEAARAYAAQFVIPERRAYALACVEALSAGAGVPEAPASVADVAGKIARRVAKHLGVSVAVPA